MTNDPTCPTCDKLLLTKQLHGVDVLHCDMCKQDFCDADLGWMQPDNNPLLNPLLEGEMVERVRHCSNAILTVMVATWNAGKSYGLGEAGEDLLMKAVAPADLTKVLYGLAQAGYIEIKVKHVAIPLNREQRRACLAAGRKLPGMDGVLVKEFDPGWALKQALPGMLPALPVLRAMTGATAPEVGES